MIGLPDDSLPTDTTFSKPHSGEGLCILPSDARNLDQDVVSPPPPQGGRGKTGTLVIVEGNIGIGKTTLARKLAQKLDYQLFLEPTVENPFLDKFYAEPGKYALKLQLWILRQRYCTYVAAVKHAATSGQGVILDRSVYSDCVFANVCRDEGYITSEGYKEYQFWRQKALENLPLPHITLFLNAPPQCCHQRIHCRGRECESDVPLDYLSKLHDEYLTFIEDMKHKGSCVLHYDWTEFQDESVLTEHINNSKTSKWSTETTQWIQEQSSLDSLGLTLESDKE